MKKNRVNNSRLYLVLEDVIARAKRINHVGFAIWITLGYSKPYHTIIFDNFISLRYHSPELRNDDMKALIDMMDTNGVHSYRIEYDENVDRDVRLLWLVPLLYQETRTYEHRI